MKHCPVEKLNSDSHFVIDLGYDSMLRTDLNKKLSAEFCIKIEAKDSDKFLSVPSAVKYFSEHPKAR